MNLFDKFKKKITNFGIEKIDELKDFVNENYKNTKNYYLNKRKQICDLPDEIVKKFDEKKNEIIE